MFKTFAFAAHASLGVSLKVSDVRNFVLVDIDAAELGPKQRVGTLSRERTRSKSVISFAYNRLWVTGSDSFAIDPSLPLFEGDQYQAALPGIFSDAAPDRWGRTLMERREAITARGRTEGQDHSMTGISWSGLATRHEWEPCDWRVRATVLS